MEGRINKKAKRTQPGRWRKNQTKNATRTGSENEGSERKNKNQRKGNYYGNEEMADDKERKHR